MKSLTVRLPDPMAAAIEAESRTRRVSKSDVVRERLGKGLPTRSGESDLHPLIADLAGSVDGLPEDLSARHKHYLKVTGYGGKRRR